MKEENIALLSSSTILILKSRPILAEIASLHLTQSRILTLTNGPVVILRGH